MYLYKGRSHNEMKTFFTLENGFLKKVIVFVFSIWMFLIIWGILQNSNLNITNITGGLLVAIIISMVISYLYLKNRYVQKGFKFIFVKNKYITVSIAVILCVFWQIMMVEKLFTPIGFDVITIYDALKNKPSAFTLDYFKHYPNNLFLVFFQKSILGALNISLSWKNLCFISLACVDVSLVFNGISVYLLNKDKLITAIYTQVFFASVFPMIIIPYSDTMVMPFVSLYILGYVVFRKNKNIILQIVGVVMLSLGVVAAYLMKPSAVVPFIAIAIFVVLKVVSQWSIKICISKLHFLIIFLIIFISCLMGFKNFENNQKHIVFDKGYSEPPVHFIAMGLTGSGGFNGQDYIDTHDMSTTKNTEYSKKLIISRLKKMGPLGYIKFLLMKNQNNTSDGTFGWNKEGNFIDAKPSTLLQEIFYPSGRYLGNFYWIAQLFWLFFVLIIFLGYGYSDEFTQIFRLAIIGGLMFLLIFEGGRSRYLIQFLPVFILLFTVVFESAYNKIKNIFNSLKIN